jgi:hypothetical protein
LQPLPASTVSEADARELKQQVVSRLAQHKQRRPRIEETAPAGHHSGTGMQRHNRIADSVAARFAKTQTYRDFLQQEAEAAIRQAEAAAEVARRNADAIAQAQQQLLDEIDQWNATSASTEEQPPAPLEIVAPVRMAEDTSNTAVLVSGLAQDESPAVARFESALHEIAAKHQDAAPQALAAMSAIVAEPVEVLPLEPSVPLPTNLLEFPRQLVAARKARARLAEGPLRDDADSSPDRAQLRIFEVEAAAVSTEPVVEGVLPEWHDIRLDAHLHANLLPYGEAAISYAPAMYVAPVSLRMMAAAVDTCCVVTGFLLAVAAVAYMSPVLPGGLTAVISAAGALFAFALFYQLLFFSLGDATPGMRYARVGLCTFSDENPTRKEMRRRIFAQLLAGMPVGLGWIWALLDEDGLGWHDRISRMYLRAY